jgi:hypothetical protein
VSTRRFKSDVQRGIRSIRRGIAAKRLTTGWHNVLAGYRRGMRMVRVLFRSYAEVLDATMKDYYGSGLLDAIFNPPPIFKLLERIPVRIG